MCVIVRSVHTGPAGYVSMWAWVGQWVIFICWVILCMELYGCVSASGAMPGYHGGEMVRSLFSGDKDLNDLNGS